jgi:hypothetical protein
MKLEHRAAVQLAVLVIGSSTVLIVAALRGVRFRTAFMAAIETLLQGMP